MLKRCFAILLFCLSANAYAHPDEYYMSKLVENSHQNPQYPFAAMIVNTKTGEILCEGINDAKVNPTFHGEMQAINSCASKYPDLNWSETTLYTTAEPCSMCQSAIVWAGIKHLVYGSSVPYLIQQGWHQISLRAEEVNKASPFYQGTVKGGVLADKTNPLFLKQP